MAFGKVVTLNKENFDDVVNKSNVPVLVDFWAAWCGPCRMIAPIIEQLAADYDGKVQICKLDVDEYSDIAMRYRIMSIPTLILFKNGVIAEKIVGVRSKAELSQIIDNVM
ncbi:MAG: thioredoxin [Bacillota bacterium]|nr:thioredoxin [Bacillota bacterium]